MSHEVTVEVSTVIDQAIEQVWRVSADEFAHIDRWDANVRTSAANGVADTEVSGRTCDQYSGRRTVEDMVKFDVAGRSFTYAITEGLPGFVASAYNTWRFQSVAANKTQVRMQLKMNLTGLLGGLMRRPVKTQMTKLLSRALEELKHYLETGYPHPRKARMQARQQR